MAIREVVENLKIPIKGYIRLGVRVETAKGSAYPQTRETFVLDDAPEVKALYGDDPKSLDICFPGNDLNKVIPTWYKYFNPSVKDANGVVRKGSLVCFGEGPCGDQPGLATWRDRTRLPPDNALGDRDPRTGFVKRACWGKTCSDTKDARGNPKCKQAMQIYCFLPLVSMGDIYVINTSSWASIRKFWEVLSHQQKVYGPDSIVGPMRRPDGTFQQGAFYRMYREETATNYRDKDGVEKKGKQFVVLLEQLDSDTFVKTHSDKLQTQLSRLTGSTMRYLPTEEESLSLPMEDIYPMIEGKSSEAAEETPPVEEILAKDPEIAAAFAALEKAKNTTFSDKARRHSILKKSHCPDVKAAVLEEISMAIAKAQPAPKAEEPPPTAEQAAASELAAEYAQSKTENPLLSDAVDTTVEPPKSGEPQKTLMPEG